MTPERRFTAQAAAVVRLDQRDGAPSKIAGYASVFYDGTDGTQYQLYDDMVERIMPGAFDRAIREDDVRALFNHDPNCLLGRSVSKTLSLSVDKKGLRYEIDPPATTVGKDVAESIRRGDLSGSSFAFVPTDVVWREVDKLLIREINAVQLWDVGPVTYPAYDASTAGMRAKTSAPPELRSIGSADCVRDEAAKWRQRSGLAAKLAGYRLRAAQVLE